MSPRALTPVSARGLGGGGVAGSLDSQVTCHQLVSVTVCIDRCGVTIHTHQVVSQTTTTTTRLRQVGDPLFFTRVAHFMAESSWQPVMSAAQRRRQRRLRSWWRHERQSIAAALATLQHHSAPWGTEDGHGEEGDFELNFAAKIRRHPPPQAAGTVCYPMDVDDVPAVGGSRPDRVSDVSGPQERVQRRIVQQTIDVVPLPMLDAPVPQMVGQLAGVLAFFNATLPVLVSAREFPFLLRDLLWNFMWAADRAAHATGAARQRRERRLRAYLRYARMSVAMAFAECQHHSAQRQKKARAREEEREMQQSAAFRTTVPPPEPELFDLFEGPGGRRGRRSECCSTPWSTLVPSALLCRFLMLLFRRRWISCRVSFSSLPHSHLFPSRLSK